VREVAPPSLALGAGSGPEGTRSVDEKTTCVTNTESPSALWAPLPAGKEVALPSPPEPPPTKAEAWTHNPPEHMQIEKVTWRMRTPQDDLDDDDGYYDPFRDA
jgi:hypothetical protein